ncbi:ComEC/Rec2 family competence protein [Seohaeicola nanhaiensis]|uniref:ComEC/Rec2 family competence protein n=1 Tax=Seohaeicola nanhaiensis TaxID=1387282 RepID=A0ABV9KFG1_9RHOB
MRTPRSWLAFVDLALLNQRGHLFPWTPVAMACGIGLYFALPVEPGRAAYAAAALIGLAAAFAAWRWPGGWPALGWAAALLAAGFSLAGLRANGVAAPVLGWRYYGEIEGRVIDIDRSASDALRILLDEVRLGPISAPRTPERVRISLHGPPAEILPGQRIRTTGHLSPPQGAVEPGGFDFRRHAWFLRTGAVGYTRKEIVTVAAPEPGGLALRIFTLRMAVSRHIQTVLPGDTGGFAAAVTTGDRSGIGAGVLTALRISNLAHLLAISGLHMGLLAGFVFAALRVALALVPFVALRLPARKLAAVGALVAAACYYALSGGNVATERAFVMTAVILLAVLVDRRAFSLRSVAMAALVVLAFRPESLLGPGFQMSFAATTALIAGFGWLSSADLPRLPGWIKPVAAVLTSSAIAGAATAPIGAAHFNTLSQYGLIANLLAVPVMGAVVVPAAVAALLLAPLGLAWVGLWVMGLGLDWILAVGHWVATFEGARNWVPSPGPLVLPLLSLGMLWLFLWQGRARLAGLPVAALALFVWSLAERPDVLIADTGGLVGVMTPEGRALSKAKGAGFIARTWLENDGDAATQQQAALRWTGADPAIRTATIRGRDIVHVIGKRGAERFTTCAPGQLVIASVPLALSGGCEVYDPKRLRFTGSLALGPEGLRTARETQGRRLWTQ